MVGRQGILEDSLWAVMEEEERGVVGGLMEMLEGAVALKGFRSRLIMEGLLINMIVFFFFFFFLTCPLPPSQTTKNNVTPHGNHLPRAPFVRFSLLRWKKSTTLPHLLSIWNAL